MKRRALLRAGAGLLSALAFGLAAQAAALKIGVTPGPLAGC